MTDLVVGLGEIGRPLQQCLELRGISVDTFDILDTADSSHSTGAPPEDKYDMIHICFPYSDSFVEDVRKYLKMGKVIVHSTVKAGTCKQIPCVYAPVRGVHKRMLEDMLRYRKYYSGDIDPQFERRFFDCKNVPDSTKLELTKVIVDTTYYGWLIMFRKLVDKEFDVDWTFADEIHGFLGNRPVMFNDGKPIGGHCVIPNLDLLPDTLISKIVRMGATDE